MQSIPELINSRRMEWIIEEIGMRTQSSIYDANRPNATHDHKEDCKRSVDIVKIPRGAYWGEGGNTAKRNDEI
jgi:hypothetical protein